MIDEYICKTLIYYFYFCISCLCIFFLDLSFKISRLFQLDNILHFINFQLCILFFILYKVVIKSIATKSTSTVFCLKLFQFNSIFVHFTQLTNSNTMNNINLLKAKSITNKIITMQIDMHPRIKFKIRFKKNTFY